MTTPDRAVPDPGVSKGIIDGIIAELEREGSENEWIECKVNHAEPKKIGEYISALSNTSALIGRDRAWIIWGIENNTWKPVGTKFKPSSVRVQPRDKGEGCCLRGEDGEDLESWLVRQLSPKISIRFFECDYHGQRIVALRIPAANFCPVAFKDTEYIRLHSSKKRLKDYPEKERILWSTFSRKTFEKNIALRGLNVDQVLALIDYMSYFRILNISVPGERSRMLARLEEDHLVRNDDSGTWSITNLGAILFARSLEEFEIIKRKALRIVFYKGVSRTGAKKERIFSEGYAACFEEVIAYLKGQLQIAEEYRDGFRQEVLPYPEISIRELIPNALIHQDFSIPGAGPMVEVFDDRIEITNPGEPIIDTLRFIDSPPLSRNEDLASFMRRLNICEERGSGIDKVIESVEEKILPPPVFMKYEHFTKTTLYAPRSFSDMDLEERVRASYQHACLCSVSSHTMTNASLRDRFGLTDKESSTVSRIIAETMKKGLIKPADPDSTSRKHARYIPFWQ